jgi:hypothetical protein
MVTRKLPRYLISVKNFKFKLFLRFFLSGGVELLALRSSALLTSLKHNNSGIISFCCFFFGLLEQKIAITSLPSSKRERKLNQTDFAFALPMDSLFLFFHFSRFFIISFPLTACAREAQQRKQTRKSGKSMRIAELTSRCN